MITVWVHSVLLADAKTGPEISFEVDRPISLSDLVRQITDGDELFHFRLVNELGQLRPHINIFVGNEKRNNLEFMIDGDVEISIFPAVSGG